MSVSVGPLSPLKDQQVWSLLNTTNFGSATTMHCGIDQTFGGTYRAILSFDISSIPLTAKVLTASLSVRVVSVVGTVPGYTINRILQRAWVEAQATWQIYSTGNSWASPGLGAETDYTATDAGSYSAPTGGTTVTHNDAPIIAQVQAGVRNTTDRHAAFLFIPDGSNGDIQWATKEHATEPEATLTIVYVVPKRRALVGVGR